VNRARKYLFILIQTEKDIKNFCEDRERYKVQGTRLKVQAKAQGSKVQVKTQMTRAEQGTRRKVQAKAQGSKVQIKTQATRTEQGTRYKAHGSSNKEQVTRLKPIRPFVFIR
jgi:hypothetical protein